jgi:predicted ester cyclase
MRRIGKAFASAYDALGYGDVDGAVKSFPDEIVWAARGGDKFNLQGREALYDHWRAGANARKIGVARVFVTDEDLLISQGVRVERSTGIGFVAIGRVRDGEIIEVHEFFTAAPEGSDGPALPSETEFITEDGDDVNQVMAEALNIAWSKRDWETIRGALADNLVLHDVATGAEVRGFDAYKTAFERRTDAFPDMNFEVLRSWAIGDYVVVEQRTRGTNTAAFGDHAPTNNSVDLEGLDIYRFERGAIVEMWHYQDDVEFMAQLRASAPATVEDDAGAKKK